MFKVREIVEHYGWTQPKLSEVSGVSRHSLSNLMNRPYEANPTHQTLVSLARVFGCEVWELYAKAPRRDRRLWRPTAVPK